MSDKSPITSSDFPDYNQSADTCTKMEQLLRSVEKLQIWFDWAFDDAGNWNADAMQQIVLAASPLGTVMPWSSPSIPSDKWLICNGLAVSRTTYADLFTLIGTTYGSGDGSITFNIPNLTDKFVYGAGSASLGATGGAAQITLTEAQLPEHSHTVPMAKKVNGDTGGGTQIIYGPDQPGLVDADIDSETTGSGDPINALPPYLALYYIIRASK